MSYQVLARKWRPKSFSSIVGQDHVVRALSNALDQQRLHHAYLFTGTRGVGKTTLSRLLAKSFNCESGITSKPCNICSACVSIDKGIFIDYLEMDAASNRGIDDMTSLLENAIYAPTVGRFKVYMLDEVHQLTGAAFNAMLKTLEEPPSHIKFILATTDPQKMPVTVLSRCLQFNLRQMTPNDISNHLKYVLTEEQIPFDATALQLISRSASGSMRDALSLLDQAIAYGGNSVNELEVRNMLGAIDQSYLYQLLQSITQNNGAEMLEIAKTMEQRSLSFDRALSDLANLLHQIAIVQSVPDSVEEDFPERVALLNLAEIISAENVQLYYQIALLARRDLGLAPDEYAGFTMALLRMLAFTPNESIIPINFPSPTKSAFTKDGVKVAPLRANTAPIIESIPTIESTIESDNTSPTPKPLMFNGNWRLLVDELKLSLARALAQHCELVKFDDNNMYLTVPEAHKHLINANYQDKLRIAINSYFNRKINLHFEIGGGENTPIAQITQEKVVTQNNAEQSIKDDAFVQALIKDFGATIIPNSIKPI